MTSSPNEHHWCMHAALSLTRQWIDRWYTIVILYVRDHACIQVKDCIGCVHFTLKEMHAARSWCHDRRKPHPTYKASEYLLEKWSYLVLGCTWLRVAKSLVALPWSASTRLKDFLALISERVCRAINIRERATELRSLPSSKLTYIERVTSLETNLG